MSDDPIRPKPPKHPRQKGGTVSKKLRDANIRAMAIEGFSHEEIAAKTSLSRSAVYRVLSSEETKQLVKEAESRITQMVDKAVSVVEQAMDNAPMDMTNALKAALPILKNHGVLKETTTLEHKFPKPTVITRPNGTQVVLGTEADDPEKEEG